MAPAEIGLNWPAASSHLDAPWLLPLPWLSPSLALSAAEAAGCLASADLQWGKNKVVGACGVCSFTKCVYAHMQKWLELAQWSLAPFMFVCVYLYIFVCVCDIGWSFALSTPLCIYVCMHDMGSCWSLLVSSTKCMCVNP